MIKIITLIAVVVAAGSVSASESSGEARFNTKKMMPAYLALSDAEALLAKSAGGQRMTKQTDRVNIGNYQVPASQVCFFGEGTMVYGGTFKQCVLWRSSTSNELITKKRHDQDTCVKQDDVQLVGPVTTTYKRCVAWEANDGNGTVGHDNGNGCRKWAKTSHAIGKTFNVSFFRDPSYSGNLDRNERYGDNFYLGTRRYAVPNCK